MTFGYLQKWIFHSLSGQSVPVLTHTLKKVFLYGQKSVLTKPTNIIILPIKKFLKRHTGNFDENKKTASSSRKSRNLSLLVHATAMWHK